MKDILVGLLAVAAGLMFCFRGYLLMRIVIPVWGFFVGFALGGAIISAITDRAFLGTVLGWIVGVGSGASLLSYGAIVLLWEPLGRSYDAIALARGWILSPDGVHMDSTGAGIIADVAADWLERQSSTE